MKNKTIAICHQTVAYGDAIGNDIAGMYDLFQSMGFAPTILCEYLHGDLGNRRVVTGIDTDTANSYGLVVYHHSTYWEQGEAFLRTYAGVPVLRYHNITPPHFYQPYSPVDTTRCQRGQDQTRRLINLPHDHYWLADSHYNRHHLLALGERSARIAVAPPFTLVDLLLYQPSLAEYTEAGPFYAFFIGRLTPNKGHQTLLKILLAYHRHIARNLRLYVVGAQDAALASYRAELEAFISRFRLPCKLYDHVPQELVTELFRSCHVYLCMSEHEGFCVPILEAQAVGLPVLAMDAAAVRDTAGVGQLVGPQPTDDADHLFYAFLLHEVLTNAELRRTLIQGGHRNVLTRFTRERVENEFLEAMWPRLGDLL